MSLSQLPEELVAHMASYLNYSDVQNFMKSSKRNRRIMQAFNMDKIKFNFMRIWMFQGRICYSVFGENRTKLILSDCPGKCLTRDPQTAINLLFDKCASVELLKFRGMEMSTVIGEFKNFKTKFEFLEVWFGCFYGVDPADFVSFCKKFKRIEFHNVQFNQELWTDEVLTGIVPYTNLVWQLKYEVTDAAHQITDLTLQSLVSKNGVQQQFNIANFHNSSTIKGIMDILKIAKERKANSLRWDFGVLAEDQSADARHFFEYNPVQVSALYKINDTIIHSDRITYTLQSIDASHCHITFQVMKPRGV